MPSATRAGGVSRRTANVGDAVRDRLFPMRPDQSNILRHPAKIKVLAMGRRWGKSKMGTVAVLSAAADGAKVAWVVPTYKNGRPLWRDAENAVAPLRRRRLVETNRSERTITFPNGGFLGIYSADNDTAIRGDWFHLVVVDEAARIGEEVWTDTIQPTLADADGDAILISTPKGKNWFWQEHERGRLHMNGEIAAFSAPTKDNPLPAIRRAYERMEERLGPDNATFRQEWNAEFVTEAEDIFDREWFTERRFDPDDGLAQKTPLRILGRYISWDTALKDKDTADYSACVVGELLDTYELRIVDVWRDRVTFPNLLDHMARMKARHNHDGKLLAEIIEDKVSGTSAYQTLAAAAPDAERDKLIPFQPQGSKDQRASQAAVWCKHRMVWLPIPGPSVRWLQPFEDEVFQQGRHFDQRDAFAQLLLYLEHYLSAGFHGRSVRAERLAQ